MSETSGSRVRRIIVHRIVSAGIDSVATWTFGWSVVWTLYILLRLLVPSVFLGGVLGVALFGFGLFWGLATLSLLRRSAHLGRNPVQIVKLVTWSYGVFGVGFLAMILAAVLWIMDLIRTN
ncbi:MAG: hypothetical protein ABIQ44_12590, partial [Chloroflexia bacterium]